MLSLKRTLKLINMKNTGLVHLLLYFLPFCIFGQFSNSYRGFGLDIGTSGSGFFVTVSSLHDSEKYSLNGELRFYDIKAKDETVVYDYYSGRYQDVGGISLVMLPIYLGVNYYPFIGKIENNFSPFIGIKLGSILTIDGNEYGNFMDRWEKAKTQISPAAFLGFGIDFKLVGQTLVSAMVGKEFIKLKYKADGNYDYSGSLIHIAFKKRLK